ncbi:hypothetical protein F4779DRAFT_643427 [Xylariaceae sp. FL0662B]|nr:hypothetical protein F4779DRAFT_643427 [Xylariaceae sp. FL0662B]
MAGSPPSPKYHRHPLFPRLSLTTALPLHLALPVKEELSDSTKKSRMVHPVAHADTAMPGSTGPTGLGNTSTGNVKSSILVRGPTETSPRRRSVESLLDIHFSPAETTHYSKLLWGSSPAPKSGKGNPRPEASILKSHLRPAASEGNSLRKTYQSSDHVPPFRPRLNNTPQAQASDEKSQHTPDTVPPIPRSSRSVRFRLPEDMTKAQSKEQENGSHLDAQGKDNEQNTAPPTEDLGATGPPYEGAEKHSARSHKRYSRAPVLPELDFTQEDKYLRILFDTSRDFTENDLLEFADLPIPAPLRLNSCKRKSGTGNIHGQNRHENSGVEGKGPATPDSQT